MVQDLLENTNTYLLNATTPDSSTYAKNATKNYTETFNKNGQSFNDVFTNANDRYSNTANKFATRDTNKNNVRDLSDRNNNVADRNSVVKKNNNNNNSSNNNNVTTNSQTVDKQAKFRESQENSRTLRDSAQSNSQKNSSDNTVSNSNSTSEINSTDTETISLNSAIDNLDLVNDITVDEEVTAEDIETLNNLLLDDTNSEDTTAETDLYINAYYQSTMDALTSDTEEVSTTDLNTLVNAETEETAQTVALNTVDELNNVDVNVNADTKTATKDTKSSLDNIDTKTNAKTQADENALKTDKLAKEDTNEKVASDKDLQKEILDNNKKVEVDTKTNETSNMKDDVLVNATDEVVEQVKQVNVNKTDENKTSFREVMEKAGLDDAKLEALNMTITNTGNAGTDLSNGFQGSAQEDIAKLAINAVNGKKDASEIANSKEFSKLVDTKNIQQEESKEISKNDILAQINNKMQAKNINGQQRITLQLTPESLGKITIELSKGKDGLQAKMLTDNAQVRDMLEKNIDGLKSTLASQGVTVNNVSVKVASASETASEFDFGRERFNQEQAQQDFAGTGERGGERDSQYANERTPENAMNNDSLADMPTEDAELEIAMAEDIELNPEAEKVAVGVGNVDIEV